MTDTAETRDKAQDTIAIASASMCHDFVAALLEELRNMPAHWSTLAEDRQQKILENLKTKVRGGVEKASQIMMRSEFQAVEATLEYVSRKKGFAAGLSVKPDALFRHSLVDAVGARVLIVIADPNRWVERMDELKVKGNQIDLFDTSSRSNYDPARDQPAYRRDQDPLAPAGKSWADLKASLGGSGKDAGTVPPGDSLTPAQESEATTRQLQEQLLADAKVEVSLGFLQSRTAAEILECVAWLAFYNGSAKPAGAEDIPDRPAWLPFPPPT